METLNTLDINSIDATLTTNLRIIMLNISLKIENRAKYTVTVDFIKMNVYINNILVGSANPYNQPIIFSILPGEECIMSFTCSTSNQNVIEVIKKGNYIVYGNGTIRGHISYHFIYVSLTQQFNVLYEIG